ncbi:midasin [Caerostris extrusa]|uniref:Midasin n=1 Tax=Caerostris extrusa TaxID=172846 RepID=A0AAV4Y809_CAEEX|nr:midasin [Caerostris extrusa]
MNPHQQGGSRKGLPQSFLNRFTRVNIRRMEVSDFQHIVSMMYPQIPQKLIHTMIHFNEKITLLVNESKTVEYRGSPFEFNLRDLLRWCEAIVKNQVCDIYERFVRSRFSDDDRQLMMKQPLELRMYTDSVQLGYSTIRCIGKSTTDTGLITIPLGQLPVLESIMKCIEMNWMPILIGSEGSGKTSFNTSSCTIEWTLSSYHVCEL